MKEQLISSYIAELARQAGFDEPCTEVYNEDLNIQNSHYATVKNSDIDPGCVATACTQAFLQKWLREKKKIHINPEPYIKSLFPGDFCFMGYYVGKILNEEGKKFTYCEDWNYPTYEEALEMALQSALKTLIKHLI